MSAALPDPAPSVPDRSPTAAVARLGVFLAAGVALAVALHAVNVLVVVLAIVAMVMLHELGHFVAAKLSGMKVTEYFFGFGPRLWSVRRGETEYGVKAIPAGGYVRITGMTMLEDVEAADEPRSYRQASFPRRVAVAAAGSTMHAVIAFVLCWSLLVFSGAAVATRPYVQELLRFSNGPSPAARAGLKPGDVFVSLDGHKVTGYGSLERVISRAAGQSVYAVVRRDGHLVRLTLHPVADTSVTEIISGHRVHPTGKPKGIIGVELTEGRSVPVGPIDAVARAGGLFGSFVTATFQGIAEVVSIHGLSSFAHSIFSSGGAHATGSSGGGGGSAQPTSILGFVEIGSQAASNDIPLLLELLAYLNVFIGLINLFPLLPFDGGHVAIALYERVRSRRGRRYHADVLKMLPFAYLFLAFFVLLGLGALYSNIVHPIHLPGG